MPSSLISTAVVELDRDAAVEGVPRRTAHVLWWLPLVGAVVLAPTALHQPLFLALLGEDGPVEWAQFVGFLATSLLLAYAAWRLFRRGDMAGAALIAIGALGIFGIAGEEISWGQRIFDLQTPEALAAANHQDELNLHNVTTVPVQLVGNYLQLILGAGGLVVPWLTRPSTPRVRVRLLRLLSPPLFITSSFGLLFIYRAVRFIWANETLTVVKFGEWPELAFAMGLVVYALLLARSLRSEPAEPMTWHRAADGRTSRFPAGGSSQP